MSYLKSVLLLLMSMLWFVAKAQTDRQLIRSGNRYFHQQNYVKAETEYRKALVKNVSNTQALYNLGTALLAQQKDSAATTCFERAGKAETSKLRKAKSYHNMGYICQRHQMYADAIKAYEEALRNDPSNQATRYNLALCQKLLKNNPQKPNPQSKDKQKDRQKKQDDKKNDRKQEQDNKQDKQPQKDPKNGMSKDNAEQLLNAALQNEKATQQRISRALQQRGSRRLQKNW